MATKFAAREVLVLATMDFFAASNSYYFFNQYCSNLLKNPTVRGLRGWRFKKQNRIQKEKEYEEKE